MLFYNLNEFKNIQAQKILKTSSIHYFLFFVFFCTFFIALPIFLSYKANDKYPRIILYIFISFPILFSLIIFRSFIKTLDPANWLIAISSSAIIIKYRSFENNHLPETDKQIASIDFHEIDSVRLAKYILKVEKRNSHTTEVKKYLEINLKENNCDKIKAKIIEERKNIEKAQASVKTHNVCLQVTMNNQIRVDISHTNHKSKALLAMLEKQVTVLPIAKYREDLRNRSFTPEELDSKIKDLRDAGNTITAIQLIRSNYNVGLKEARKYIDDLTKTL